MVSHPFHSCISIKYFELHVWTDIVWMVMNRIIFLKYERLDIASTKYIQRPIIKMDLVHVIEEHLSI